MQKVTSLSILATTFDKIRLTLLGFVFHVGFLTLPKFLYAVSELALIEVSAKPIVKIVST
jgi:hypothetical protein